MKFPYFRRWALRGLSAAMLAALAGCGASSPAGAGGGDTVAATGAADYLKPPEVLVARRAADGAVVLAGRAVADAIVRLSTPDGGSLGVTAGSDGGWSLSLPPSAAPRLFILSAEVAGRAVPGEGELAVLPAPYAPAVLARAGGGSAVLHDASEKPQILALDYDGGGGASVSGVARPGAPVRLDLDDHPTNDGRADRLGRFALPAVMSPGAHSVRISTPDAVTEVRVEISPAKALSGKPFQAEHTVEAWRIDWTPPGGGLQTTLVFDAAVANGGG